MNGLANIEHLTYDKFLVVSISFASVVCAHPQKTWGPLIWHLRGLECNTTSHSLLNSYNITEQLEFKCNVLLKKNINIARSLLGVSFFMESSI